MKETWWGVVLFVLLFFQQVISDDGFVKTRGVQLVLNEVPFYANGFNGYWLMYIASDPSQRDKVSSAFQEAKNHGLSIARTWAFSDGGYQPLQNSPGSYNEQMFQVSLDLILYCYYFFIFIILWFWFLIIIIFVVKFVFGSKGFGFCGI